MQTIIQQIIEIDKMAQQKYIDAEAYKQKAEQDTLNKKDGSRYTKKQ